MQHGPALALPQQQQCTTATATAAAVPSAATRYASPQARACARHAAWLRALPHPRSPLLPLCTLQVARLGVTSVLVDGNSGVCLQSLEQGLKAFADSKQAADS